MSDRPANEAEFRLIRDVVFGENVVVRSFANLYGCRIGDNTSIGTFVEIQAGVTVGARCKLQSHTFVCHGVTIEDEVFVGHGVMFINDKMPRATTELGSLQAPGDWRLDRTFVSKGASIGTGAVVLGGITIGCDSMVGAGAVVTRDVPDGAVVSGIPARVKGTFEAA